MKQDGWTITMSGCRASSLVLVSVQVLYRGAALTVSVGAMGVEDEGIVNKFANCQDSS